MNIQHYCIPGDHKGQFLLDALKGGPKIEVKAVFAKGADVEEVLSYFLSPYGETLKAESFTVNF